MGEKITHLAKDKCFVLIAAPGDPLNVHEQNPPTDLTIFVNRAKYSETDEQFILPDPLSDPIVEQLVKRRTAETYEVKEGVYGAFFAIGSKAKKVICHIQEYAKCSGYLILIYLE